MSTSQKMFMLLIYDYQDGVVEFVAVLYFEEPTVTRLKRLDNVFCSNPVSITINAGDSINT